MFAGARSYLGTQVSAVGSSNPRVKAVDCNHTIVKNHRLNKGRIVMNTAAKSICLLTLNIFVLWSFTSASGAAPETYSIDRDHSFANWTIRHVVSRTSGTFSDIQGKIVIDPEDLGNLKVDATINVFSLNSSHRERDAHLLIGDFLNAHEYKTIQFAATKVEAKGKTNGILHGRLTLHGITRDVQFPFELLGFGPDPWGGIRVGFEAATKLKRSDFGINWGLDMPGGGPVGDEVNITLLIEGVKLDQDGKPLIKK
jgi:polyisoprenoid-binding protein YceI